MSNKLDVELNAILERTKSFTLVRDTKALIELIKVLREQRDDAIKSKWNDIYNRSDMTKEIRSSLDNLVLEKLKEEYEKPY